MQIQLYNTRTKKIEKLKPLDGKTIRIYSCGPTVYDHAHIGNLTSFVFADTLRRVAHFVGGFKVKHVMNLTDVDDKTIANSQKQTDQTDPNDSLKQLTSFYGKLFLEDIQAIGIDVKAIEFPRATDYIEKIQALIKKLYDLKIAYIADDGVYFSIGAYQKNRKYGQLANVVASNLAEARINNDEYDKESAHDFALWKTQKPGEPSWEFALDNKKLDGRPGWHIECSVMSVDLLGQPFDIHTGGIDLAFPHHENEIAQSTAGDQPEIYANFFCHNEHLLVEGKKMSKSLNNFYKLSDIVDDKIDALGFRMRTLESNYRAQMQFTHTSLRDSQNRLNKWRRIADLRWQARDNAKTLGNEFFIDSKKNIKQALTDDLNTAQALAEVDQMINAIISPKIEGINPQDLDHFKDIFRFLDEALGLQLLRSKDIEDYYKALIKERTKLRQSEEFLRDASIREKSDQIRTQLEEQGIGLEDTGLKSAPFWHRLNN